MDNPCLVCLSVSLSLSRIFFLNVPKDGFFRINCSLSIPLPLSLPHMLESNALQSFLVSRRMKMDIVQGPFDFIHCWEMCLYISLSLSFCGNQVRLQCCEGTRQVGRCASRFTEYECRHLHIYGIPSSTAFLRFVPVSLKVRARVFP